MNKTEYRIITYDSKRYLQFKTVDVDIKTKYPKFFQFWKTPITTSELVENWRFVPSPGEARFSKDLLNPVNCPTKLTRYLDEFKFLSSFHGQEKYSYPFGVTWFSKQYPDIEKYFEKEKIERAKYLSEKEAEKSVPTVYL